MGIYVGVGSAAKTVTGVYVGVGSATKTVSAVYVGVGGAAKLVWPDEVYLTGDDATETFTLHNYATGTSSERTMTSKSTSGSYIYFTTIKSTNSNGTATGTSYLWIASDSTYNMSAYSYVNFRIYGCMASSTSGTRAASITPTIYFAISDDTDTRIDQDTYVSWSHQLGSSSSTYNYNYVTVNVSNCTKTGHIKIGYASGSTSSDSYLYISVYNIVLSNTDQYASGTSVDYTTVTYTG